MSPVNQPLVVAFCQLCHPPRGMLARDLLPHLRDAHPAHYGRILAWPDGKPVIIDPAPGNIADIGWR